MTGRPSKYSVEVATTICDRISMGESLRSICRDKGMPSEAAVRQWAVEDREGFYAQYARAREAQADYWAEQIIEISDDGQNDTYTDGDGNERTNQDVIARSRLRVDTRKWLMARMAPKKYGDKVVQEITGKDGGPVETVTRVELVAADGKRPD